MAIFVAKGHSQDPQTMGVRLLGGCVYYAEYGMKLPLRLFFIRPHKIDSMFYLRIFWESYARMRKNNTKFKNYTYFTTGFLSLCIL